MYNYSSLATVTFMFMINDNLVWRDKTVTRALEHFMFFAVFKNLKSSFSEDNMPGHALDIFIENATEIV